MRRPHRGAPGTQAAPRPATPDAGDAGLNVLVFTHSLEYGGAQLYLLELLERLGERGLRFTVVSPADGPLRERFERTGSRVHLSPLPAPWEHRLYDDRIAELTALAAPQAFDLVIGNTVLVFHCAEIAARLGVPSILARASGRRARSSSRTRPASCSTGTRPTRGVDRRADRRAAPWG